METEIKLRIHPDDIPAAVDAVCREGALEAGPSTRKLESRYYDTSDLALKRRGIALRVRKVGDGFVQTVKTEGDAGEGLLARGEWETPVPSFTPSLAALNGEIAGGTCVELAQLFSTEVDRQKVVVAYPPVRADASRIEVAFDRGRISADGREEPITEMELELLQGNPVDLFDLGARLAKQLPLSFYTDTKSARGYRLAIGNAPAAARAERLDFSDDATLDEGIGSAFRASMRHWFANQTAAFDGRDVEGVHQMRIALRRLRSAIRFFRDYIADPQLDWMEEESKWIAGNLGAARDWDVFLTETLPPLFREWPRHPGLIAMEAAARTAHREGYAAARIAMLSPRYTAFVMKMCGWIERSGWREGLIGEDAAKLDAPLQHHATQLMEKAYRRALRAGGGFSSLTREQKHALRIVMKKLRYAGDFFRSLYRKKDVRPFRAAMVELLEDLGKLNDLTVAETLGEALIEVSGSEPAAVAAGIEALLTWYGAGLDETEDCLGAKWKTFAAAAPYWRR